MSDKIDISRLFIPGDQRKFFDESKVHDPVHTDRPSYIKETEPFNFGGREGPIKFRASGAMHSPEVRNKSPEILPTPHVASRLFNDIHCHMADYSGRMHYLPDVINAADMIGINRFTMIPIPTMVVSKMGDRTRLVRYDKAHHCGETYYIPEKWNSVGSSLDLDREALKAIAKFHELRVDGDVDTNLLTDVAESLKEGRIIPDDLGRMDLGMTGLHLGDPAVTKTILKKLMDMKNKNDGIQDRAKLENCDMNGNRLRFSLIGEVTLRKEVVEELFAGDSQANLEENITPTREAMRLAGVVGLPWLLHCDIDHMVCTKNYIASTGITSAYKGAEKPRHLESIKKLFRACPNTDIIWAHAGGLGRFVKAGEKHNDHLRELLQDLTLSHVKIDISWHQVADQLAGAGNASPDAVQEKWAKFFIEFQDRILFGSDTLTPKTNAAWLQTYNIYSPGLFNKVRQIEFAALEAKGELPQGVTTIDEFSNEHSPTLSKILFENYEQLMDTARMRIDFFTDNVLKEVAQGASYIGGADTVDVQAIAKKRNSCIAEKIESLNGQIEQTTNHIDKAALISGLNKLNLIKDSFRNGVISETTAFTNSSMKSFGTDRANDAHLLSSSLLRKKEALAEEIRNGIASLERNKQKIKGKMNATNGQYGQLDVLARKRYKSLIEDLDQMIHELRLMNGEQAQSQCILL